MKRQQCSNSDIPYTLGLAEPTCFPNMTCSKAWLCMMRESCAKEWRWRQVIDAFALGSQYDTASSTQMKS